MYQGVSFDRHFYNLGDAIIIHDNMESDTEHMYSQLFHASEAMKVVESSKDETLFSLETESGMYYIRVSQLLKNGDNVIIHGDMDKEGFGYISKEMNHLDMIDTLKYDVKGSNVDIVTLITIEDENGSVENIEDIVFDEKNNKFSVKKSLGESFDIVLQSRERIYADKVEVEKKDTNTFVFTNQNRAEGMIYT